MASATARAVEVRADTVVRCRADQARDRLWTLLAEAHDGPEKTAHAMRLAVGPGGGAIHKQVDACIGRPRLRRGSYVLTLRWEPSGALAGLYPTLDAGVGITPIDASTCLLTVLGSYVPPFGAVGSAVDRAGLRHIAESTIRAVTRRLAYVVTHQPAATDEEVLHERDAGHTPIGC